MDCKVAKLITKNKFNTKNYKESNVVYMVTKVKISPSTGIWKKMFVKFQIEMGQTFLDIENSKRIVCLVDWERKNEKMLESGKHFFI